VLPLGLLVADSGRSVVRWRLRGWAHVVDDGLGVVALYRVSGCRLNALLAADQSGITRLIAVGSVCLACSGGILSAGVLLGGVSLIAMTGVPPGLVCRPLLVLGTSLGI
jgi:hypothetical protein